MASNNPLEGGRGSGGSDDGDGGAGDAAGDAPDVTDDQDGGGGGSGGGGAGGAAGDAPDVVDAPDPGGGDGGSAGDAAGEAPDVVDGPTDDGGDGGSGPAGGAAGDAPDVVDGPAGGNRTDAPTTSQPTLAPDDRFPRPGGGQTPPDDRRDPPAGPDTTTPDQPPTDTDGTADAPPTDSELGPMADWKRDYAEQFDRFGPEDVVFRQVERPGGEFPQPYITESTVRETLQEDVASQSEYVDPEDVEVSQTEDGGYEASVPQSTIEENQREALRQQAAEQWDVSPEDVVVVREGDQLRAGTDPDANVEFNDPIGGPIEDYEDVSGTARQETVGQTTDPTYDPDADQPGALEALQGGTTAFFRDPYGTTVGYGIESMEDELSEEVGVDVGETITQTGETLADRPIDSLVTGVATIRGGSAAAAQDATEGTAAAGVAAGATGTGTGTATGVLGSIGVTGAAAAMPVGAAVFGARGLQEEDITLPGAETAPSPAEDVDEVTVPGEQFPSEIEPTDGAAGSQPEIEVTGETEVGAPTTRLPVGEGRLYEPEIDVSGETRPGIAEPELPVGSGDGGTTETPAGDTGGSVVPGEYPQAGRDFAADPSREYVPGQRPGVRPEAAAGVVVGDQGQSPEIFQRDNPLERNDDDFLTPSRESVEVDDDPVTQRQVNERAGDYVSSNDEATSPELEVEQAPLLVGTPQAELTPLTGTQSGQDSVMNLMLGEADGRPVGETRGEAFAFNQSPAQAATQAQTNALAEMFSTPNTAEFGYPGEVGNPTTTGFQFPPGFGYGYGSGSGSGGRGRGPPPGLPDFDLDGGDQSRQRDDPSGFDRFWERPVAESEDVFEDLFGR